MTPHDRRSLAEQLQANSLTHEILDGIEHSAIEALVYAATDTARIEAQWRVRAARSFRQDFEASLLSNRGGKGAPV